MKKIIGFVGAVVAGLVAVSGIAFAAPGLSVPEPGTLALVGVAVVALIAISREGKKYLAEGFSDDSSPFSGCLVRVGQTRRGLEG